MIDALIKRVSVTYKCYEMYKIQPNNKKGKYSLTIGKENTA
jgi:hypothetical protein